VTTKLACSRSASQRIVGGSSNSDADSANGRAAPNHLDRDLWAASRLDFCNAIRPGVARFTLTAQRTRGLHAGCGGEALTLVVRITFRQMTMSVVLR